MDTTFLSRFTPSTMSREALEAIFVKREPLAQRVVELIRDSALTASKHHTLLVGPRGIGKTHFVSLVYYRLRGMEDLQGRLVIAWLREEEWGVASFLDLVLAILRALCEEYPEVALDGQVQAVYDLQPAEAERAAAALLKRVVGSRSLLIIAENLGEIFAGLELAGQQKWRSFLQENPFSTILATNQSLFDGISRQTDPFYGFFRTEHLQPLSLDEAIELLGNIARYREDDKLASLLRTPTGRDRVQAVEHLACSNPRVYVIFSQFINYESLDELVEPLLRTLDDLTPFYQSRMALLPAQQRKIVDLLCECHHPVQVSEIAQRCFVAPPTASSQLARLRELGYVHTLTLGRESYYEIHEPLMRLCAEVKKQRGEPIRLFVEFLRLWYSRAELEQRVSALRPDASFEREYLLRALQPADAEQTRAPFDRSRAGRGYSGSESQDSDAQETPRHDSQDGGQSKQHVHSDTGTTLDALARGEESLAALERTLALAPEDAAAWRSKGRALGNLGRREEALAAFERALVLAPNHAESWRNKGVALGGLGHYEEALVALDQALVLAPNDGDTWRYRGSALNSVGRYEEALAAFERTLALAPNDALGWHGKGFALNNVGRYGEALAALEQALVLAPDDADNWRNKGFALGNLERHEEALAAFERALVLDPDDAGSWRNKGVALSSLGRHEEELAAAQRALALAPHDARCWRDKGVALSSLGREEEALATFDRARELAPDDIQASWGRANVLDSLGRFEESLAEIDSAIAGGAQVGNLYYLRAVALLALNRWSEAIAALDDALGRVPDASNISDWLLTFVQRLLEVGGAAGWPLRVAATLESCRRHGAVGELGRALVQAIVQLRTTDMTNTARSAWLRIWKESAGDTPELQVPLRLLGAAVPFITTGDRRTLLDLSLEERAIVLPLLDVEELPVRQ